MSVASGIISPAIVKTLCLTPSESSRRTLEGFLRFSRGIGRTSTTCERHSSGLRHVLLRAKGEE